jgi:predicted ATP-grasp superfamily ATP-dependent carboligase
MATRERQPMRVFVYEYLSSTPEGSASSSASLQGEGWAMLSAVLADLARCPEVQVSTLLAPSRRSKWEPGSANVIAHFAPADRAEDAFRSLAADADWSLVIAPELDGILERRCRLVTQAGGRLLGPALNAVRGSADKLLLMHRWRELQIPTPPLSAPYPLVYKPRFGAGSQATFLVHNEDELSQARRSAAAEGWHGEPMLQAYVAGLPVSVAFLAAGQRWHALPAVEQRLSSDGRFRYLGGRLPLPPRLDRRARALAERAARAIDGWRGWFGVDLILGDAEDGSADAAIEINPRLTTSYVGLRRLARFNLAEALLAAATGSPLPTWNWRRDTIVFQADGRVEKFRVEMGA